MQQLWRCDIRDYSCEPLRLKDLKGKSKDRLINLLLDMQTGLVLAEARADAIRENFDNWIEMVSDLAHDAESTEITSQQAISAILDALEPEERKENFRILTADDCKEQPAEDPENTEAPTKPAALKAQDADNECDRVAGLAVWLCEGISDGVIKADDAIKALEAWRWMYAGMNGMLAVPDCIFSDDSVIYTWQSGRVYIDAEIFRDRRVHFFEQTDTSVFSGDWVDIGQELPERVKDVLRAFCVEASPSHRSCCGSCHESEDIDQSMVASKEQDGDNERDRAKATPTNTVVLTKPQADALQDAIKNGSIRLSLSGDACTFNYVPPYGMSPDDIEKIDRAWKAKGENMTPWQIQMINKPGGMNNDEWYEFVHSFYKDDDQVKEG